MDRTVVRKVRQGIGNSFIMRSNYKFDCGAGALISNVNRIANTYSALLGRTTDAQSKQSVLQPLSSVGAGRCLRAVKLTHLAGSVLNPEGALDNALDDGVAGGIDPAESEAQVCVSRCEPCRA